MGKLGFVSQCQKKVGVIHISSELLPFIPVSSDTN
jgi:hypothetical protein